MNHFSNFLGIAFRGEKAAQMLQGQLTADVSALVPGSACLAAACNPKGRMIANGLLICEGQQSFVLVASNCCVDALETSMQRLLPFFKVTMERCQIFGHIEQTAPYAPTWPGRIGVALDEASVTNPISQHQWLETWWRHGVVFIRHQHQLTHYIPSDLHWDRFAVSFSKGCYTGQEIIARVHYRGAPKQLCIFAETTQKPTATDITNTAGEPVGTLLDSLETANGWLIAAQIMKAQLNEQQPVYVDTMPIRLLHNPEYP